jgi:hypothetical protein
VGNPSVVIKSQILVIYKVHNGAYQAQASCKKVKDSQSDLIGDEALNTCNTNEAKQSGD